MQTASRGTSRLTMAGAVNPGFVHWSPCIKCRIKHRHDPQPPSRPPRPPSTVRESFPQAVHGTAVPSRAEPSRAERSRAEPSPAEPSRVPGKQDIPAERGWLHPAPSQPCPAQHGTRSFPFQAQRSVLRAAPGSGTVRQNRGEGWTPQNPARQQAPHQTSELRLVSASWRTAGAAGRFCAQAKAGLS